MAVALDRAPVTNLNGHLIWRMPFHQGQESLRPWLGVVNQRGAAPAILILAPSDVWSSRFSVSGKGGASEETSNLHCRARKCTTEAQRHREKDRPRVSFAVQHRSLSVPLCLGGANALSRVYLEACQARGKSTRSKLKLELQTGGMGQGDFWRSCCRANFLSPGDQPR